MTPLSGRTHCFHMFIKAEKNKCSIIVPLVKTNLSKKTSWKSQSRVDVSTRAGNMISPNPTRILTAIAWVGENNSWAPFDNTSLNSLTITAARANEKNMSVIYPVIVWPGVSQLFQLENCLESARIIRQLNRTQLFPSQVPLYSTQMDQLATMMVNRGCVPNFVNRV